MNKFTSEGFKNKTTEKKTLCLKIIFDLWRSRKDSTENFCIPCTHLPLMPPHEKTFHTKLAQSPRSWLWSRSLSKNGTVRLMTNTNWKNFTNKRRMHTLWSEHSRYSKNSTFINTVLSCIFIWPIAHYMFCRRKGNLFIFDKSHSSMNCRLPSTHEHHIVDSCTINVVGVFLFWDGDKSLKNVSLQIKKYREIYGQHHKVTHQSTCFQLFY